MQIENLDSDPLMEFAQTYNVPELHKANLSRVAVAIADIFYHDVDKVLHRADNVVTEHKGIVNDKELLSVIFTDNSGKRHALYGIFNEDVCTFSLHRFTSRYLKCPLNLFAYRLKQNRL